MSHGIPNTRCENYVRYKGISLRPVPLGEAAQPPAYPTPNAYGTSSYYGGSSTAPNYGSSSYGSPPSNYDGSSSLAPYGALATAAAAPLPTATYSGSPPSVTAYGGSPSGPGYGDAPAVLPPEPNPMYTPPAPGYRTPSTYGPVQSAPTAVPSNEAMAYVAPVAPPSGTGFDYGGSSSGTAYAGPSSSGQSYQGEVPVLSTS